MIDLENKRIIFVLPDTKLGGAESQALLLANALKENHGAHVEMVGFGQDGILVQRGKDLDINVKAFPLDWRGEGWLRTNLRRWKQLLKLALYLRSLKPDILLPYCMMPNVACGLVWRLTGARSCIWNQRDEGLWRLNRFYESWAVCSIPWFSSNSINGSRFLQQQLNIPGQKIRVIHNGVKLSPSIHPPAMWREKLGVDSDRKIVVMVANFSLLKNHMHLIRAWKQVVENLPSADMPHLVLAGRDRGTLSDCKALAFDLGLYGHVHFPGVVEDVSGLLNTACLYVFTSEREGCSNALLEAMAAGVPIIASKIDANLEVLGSKHPQFLVELNNDIALARNIEDLLSDGTTREVLAMSYRERAEKDFSLTQLLDSTTQYIKMALGG